MDPINVHLIYVHICTEEVLGDVLLLEFICTTALGNRYSRYSQSDTPFILRSMDTEKLKKQTRQKFKFRILDKNGRDVTQPTKEHYPIKCHGFSWILTNKMDGNLNLKLIKIITVSHALTLLFNSYHWGPLFTESLENSINSEQYVRQKNNSSSAFWVVAFKPLIRTVDYWWVSWERLRHYI